MCAFFFWYCCCCVAANRNVTFLKSLNCVDERFWYDSVGFYFLVICFRILQFIFIHPFCCCFWNWQLDAVCSRNQLKVHNLCYCFFLFRCFSSIWNERFYRKNLSWISKEKVETNISKFTKEEIVTEYQTETVF